MTQHDVPAALDPNVQRREIVVSADAEAMEKMRKEGHFRHFTVQCDEGEHVGGDDTAPAPLAYLALSLGF